MRITTAASLVLAIGTLLGSQPASAQASKPATRVLFEGEVRGEYICKLDNGVTKAKGEGPCSDFLGICMHENGRKVNCSDCYKFANCR